MENFFVNLASAAIVASAGGIAFLAYKHPKGYKRLTDNLSRAVAILGVGASAWLLGIQFSVMALHRHLDPASAAAAEAAIKTLWPPAWAAVSFTLIWFYIIGLRLLPRILEDDEKENEADEESP